MLFDEITVQELPHFCCVSGYSRLVNLDHIESLSITPFKLDVRSSLVGMKEPYDI